ncbi:MAG: ATP-binding protein [Gammaproteobacteria bacterium]|nr:ATP-binding protein [Gammaproteobacteria bacterium]
MGLTGMILDKAFRTNINNLQQENLRTQIYSLLAAAELDENDKFQLPDEMTEPRLNLSESTLHARVTTKDNEVVWQSKSMLNINLPFIRNKKMGEFSFSEITQNAGNYTLVTFSTQWFTDNNEQTYIFHVAENKNVLSSQVNLFRKELWSWLAGVSVLLIIIQTIILNWGLKPLRYVADDLLKIENGQKKRLATDYPKEITPLTQNLNQLLDSSQNQLRRYRDALGNMAHSLKTPLAVLQGIFSSTESKDKDTALEQLKTINEIVEYQLQRASTVGQLQFSEAISIRPIAEKIINTLDKVYKDKNVTAQINIPGNINIKMDEGDLFEMLGNLIENAYKWCTNQVRLSANKHNRQLQLIIEDNGPGISSEQRELILLRGKRADQSTPGHGLGLAMVNDMLLLYNASMEISKSSMDGAKILINLQD